MLTIRAAVEADLKALKDRIAATPAEEMTELR